MGGIVVSASAQAVKRALPVDEQGNPIPEQAEPLVPATQPPLPPLPPIGPQDLPVKRALPVEEPAPAPPAPVEPPPPAKKKEEPAKSKSDEPKKEPKKAPAPPKEPEPPKYSIASIPMATLISPVRVKKDLEASWKTMKDARTVKLEVAAPRGQIVDRNGVCLARNVVANYLALTFPLLDPSTDENAIAFARVRIAEVNKRLGKTWDIPDARIAQHYRDRRWLPLMLSKEGDIGIGLTNDEIEKIKPLLGKGVIVSPTFVRNYPKLDTACHVLGYTGISRPLPLGPIIDGEPLIEEPIGKAGLEERFENDLRGKPGMVNIMFNPDGTKLSEEVLRRPIPGYNVVTTLDYDMQRFAEEALRKHASNGGAMVIMDVRNGDVLALASYPTFNLNDFIPRITTTRYAELVNDPKKPLSGRAFQGEYYPASTFKVVTALAGLESGAVTPGTVYDCDSSYQIGDRVFHNWNKEGEGPMNVVGAIKRSCNTWFYQAGIQTGSKNVVDMAERMGFGQPTGIPLPEKKGFVPSDAYYMQTSGHNILNGMLASICIGQVVTATPLQVAQCMSTVADGTNMPKVRLVKQVQDYNDNVVQAWPPEVRKQVNLTPLARDTVVKGMVAVVNGEGGTGHNAQVEGVKVAGKTGTAQWIVNEDRDKSRWLAWFTGFLPADNPVYAFAVVYEGGFGEGVSGGAVAAPIVQSVLQKIHDNEKAGDPLTSASEAPPRAELVSDDASAATSAPKAEAVKEAPPPPPEPAKPPGIKGLFKRLFGR